MWKIIKLFLIFGLIFVNLGAGFVGGLLAVRLNLVGTSSVSDSRQTVNYEVIREEDLFVEVVENTKKAVVSVIITKDLPVYEEVLRDPFGFGFGIRDRRQVGEEERQVGAGSGFLVSADGYIVTNRHVVDEEDAEYTVVLNDGEQLDAEVVGRDLFLDIAVLKVEGENYPFLEFSQTDDIKVGQQVIAIGNTLGEFSNTVSSGIVSGLYRNIVAGSGSSADALSDLIQTDASISQGNSGGPLIGIDGKVLGVNVAVAAQGENIGFAIPADPVSKIVESVKTQGKIVRPFIGVRYTQLNPVTAQLNDLEYDYGAIIVSGDRPGEPGVIPDSPANKAGILENDIILEVNGVKLDEQTSLQSEIQKYDVGDTLTLKVATPSRDPSVGYEEKQISLTLEEARQ